MKENTLSMNLDQLRGSEVDSESHAQTPLAMPLTLAGVAAAVEAQVEAQAGWLSDVSAARGLVPEALVLSGACRPVSDDEIGRSPLHTPSLSCTRTCKGTGGRELGRRADPVLTPY